MTRPPLREEEFNALRGCMVPVEVDAESGAVLDGHNRVQICKELGRRFIGADIDPAAVRVARSRLGC